jgi:predicted tellurium resistance membrane protein TerC
VVLGLLISIPIVVFGSKLVLRLVERFPVIIQLGAAVLAFTAAQMVINEKLLDPVFDGGETINFIARIATYSVAIVGVLGMGWWTSKRQEKETPETPSA